MSHSTSPAAALLDAVFAEIREAMERGDQGLANALARVLARATRDTRNVEAARVIVRTPTIAARPFGSGDALDAYRRPQARTVAPDPITSPRGYDAAVRDAYRARFKARDLGQGTIPREPAPRPLPRLSKGDASPFRPSPTMRRATVFSS